MKVIDLDLFDPEAFVIKSAGEEFNVTFIPANLELRLLQLQPEINERATDFKKLQESDVTKWRDVIKKIIVANNEDAETKPIDKLSPLQVIAVMMSFMKYINDRSQVIYQAFDEDTQKEIKKVEADIKKKMTSAS